MTFSDNNPLGQILLDACSRFPSRVAFRCAHSELTYIELQSAVTCLAHGLRRYGIGRGALVGISLQSDQLEIPVSVLALTLLGASWIKYGEYLNGHASIKLTHLLHDDAQRPVERASILLQDVWHDKQPGLQALEFAGYASADDTWFMPSSSGTTGRSKTMSVSCRALSERIFRLTEYSGEDGAFSTADLFSRDMNLSCLHLFHTLRLGGTYLFSYDYHYLLSQKVQLVVGSPRHLSKFLAGVSPPETPALCEVRVVGGALLPRLLTTLLQYFAVVRTSYGSTETGPVCAKLFAAPAQEVSQGTCYPDVTLEIVDENGLQLAPGTEGVVRIRTSSQVSGYVRDHDEMDFAFRDGWFYPGDRGRLSAAGELSITGRERDIVNISGVKLNIAAIDGIILSQDSVADAVCFSVSDARGLEVLAALVSLVPGANEKEVVKSIVRALLKADYPVYAMPQTIYRVDEIPRNANGKAARHEAVALAAGLRPIARVG